MATYRDIPGHPGYQVSTMGIVRSFWGKGCKPRVQKSSHCLSSTPKNGYPFVGLGRGVGDYVHRLVLITFVGPCPEGLECRHLDDDQQNSRLSNLAWGTRSQNCKDRTTHGTFIGENHSQSKLTEADVLTIRSSSFSGRALGRQFGVVHGTIQKILKGETWPHLLEGGAS